MLWRCCPNRLVAASMPLAPLAFAKQSPPVLGDEDSALQDQTFSIVTTTPHFFEPWNASLRRSTCPGEYESECVWAVGYGSFASREVILYKDVMFCSSIIVCTWLSKSALEIVEL